MPTHLLAPEPASIPANRAAEEARCEHSNITSTDFRAHAVTTEKEVVNVMSDVTTADSAWDRRRWLILGVIGLAQLMVVLDLTVMNVALPSAQRALGFTTVDRQWVVTAYTLAFGSLLLLGGRLADLLGRKVTFLAGLAGFAGVSAIGGASVNFAMLVTARACQGAFAALLVPSALSLLTTTFTEQKDRSKGFAVYGAIAGAGLFGIFLFLTYSLQKTLGSSPLVTGLAFLPMSVGLIVAANLSTIVLMPRFGPKPLVGFGMLAAAGGTAWLAQLGPHTGYTTGVLGPLILAGVGVGMVVAPPINT